MNRPRVRPSPTHRYLDLWWRRRTAPGLGDIHCLPGNAMRRCEFSSGCEQSTMRPDVPTEDERLDFLRQVIAYSEWTIRSFDTKAQISIVAFVLSMSPLWSISTSACPRAGSSFIMAFLLLLFVTCVLLLAFVVLAGTAMESETTVGWPTKGLIYVRSASQITATSDRLKDLTSEAELVTETLNVARIRVCNWRCDCAACAG